MASNIKISGTLQCYYVNTLCAVLITEAMQNIFLMLSRTGDCGRACFFSAECSSTYDLIVLQIRAGCLCSPTY